MVFECLMLVAMSFSSSERKLVSGVILVYSDIVCSRSLCKYLWNGKAHVNMTAMICEHVFVLVAFRSWKM